jgi:hypothetical protein
MTAMLGWLLVGMGSGALHLWWLRRDLERVARNAPAVAGRRIVGGFVARLLALTPILYLAARGGLVACLAWVLGALLARWVVVGYGLRAPAANAPMSDERG